MHRDGPDAGRDVIRKSIGGFAVGAALFGAVGLWLNVRIGAPLLSNPGPVAILAVIGGTVGGLVAPLFHRRRERTE